MVGIVDVNIRIVYDNEPLKEGLKSGWGFSCLIESERTILFDAGWDGALLLYNMKVLGVEPDKIDAIVLSHSHWDHISGLPRMLYRKGDLQVYAPKSFSNHLKGEISKRADLIEVSKPEKLFDDIYTTGELGKDIKEQSLILNGKEGIFIITGCAHPGLKEILRVASDFGSVYGIVGGFHGFSEFYLLKKTKLLVPCHCTIHKDEIARCFPDAYQKGGVGWCMEI